MTSKAIHDKTENDENRYGRAFKNQNLIVKNK
jgi:hypothetical protein